MRIFFFTSRFPYPLEKGDKLRAYHQIRYLSKYHEIHLCALSDISVKEEHIQRLSAYCKTVHVLPLKKSICYKNALFSLLSDTPIQVAYFQNKIHQKKIKELIANIRPDHIFCQLIRCAAYLKDIDIPKTLDYMDAFSFGIKNKAQEVNFPWSSIWARESSALARFENEVFQYFNQHIIISKQDKEALQIPEKSLIKVIPNGVDFDFFKPAPRTKKYDILFVGNMGYPPNQLAAKYLVKRILPILSERGYHPKVLLAGARPNKEILNLSSKLITVSGWMDDIRDAYNASRIVVAPIFTGSGLQNKILEAMAMGLPCVTSEQVTKGIEAKAGEHLAVASTPQTFAKEIVELLENESLQEKIRNRAKNWVFENYQWNKIVQNLNQTITANHER